MIKNITLGQYFPWTPSFTNGSAHQIDSHAGSDRSGVLRAYGMGLCGDCGAAYGGDRSLKAACEAAVAGHTAAVVYSAVCLCTEPVLSERSICFFRWWILRYMRKG